MTPRHPIPRLYRALGYLAIWPALYALGVLVLLAELLVGEFPKPDSIGYILLCAQSCYLLDRVKVSDHRQDPADALALPDRAMLFAQFSMPIRTIVFVECLAASGIGWAIHPLLAPIPILALGVVHLYAGRSATPSTPRLKDLPALKAFMIASGHLALGGAVVWGNHHNLIEHLRPTDVAAAVGVWFIIVGDAVLCDIDDHESDRVYSTKSLAVLFGPVSAWISALIFIVIGSGLIVLGHAQRPVTITIGATLIATTAITVKNTNHRDFVDARLLPIVLFWIWILS
jgi:4-hydroxybenzoate polyprenyltransferase